MHAWHVFLDFFNECSKFHIENFLVDLETYQLNKPPPRISPHPQNRFWQISIAYTRYIIKEIKDIQGYSWGSIIPHTIIEFLWYTFFKDCYDCFGILGSIVWCEFKPLFKRFSNKVSIIIYNIVIQPFVHYCVYFSSFIFLPMLFQNLPLFVDLPTFLFQWLMVMLTELAAATAAA